MAPCPSGSHAEGAAVASGQSVDSVRWQERGKG